MAEAGKLRVYRHQESILGRDLCARREFADKLCRTLIVALVVGCWLAPAGSAAAEVRATIGWGRLLNNDALGDGEDRWRTGSYTFSGLVGPTWQGHAPSTPGSIIEWRFRTEIIAPNNLIEPAPSDRDYVGALSFGAHTHWSTRSGSEASLGLDLVAVGEQTGLASFQEDIHRAIGLGKPSLEGNQVDDGVYPTVVGEFAHRYPLGSSATLRPFLEAQAGVETFIRAGADLLFGRYWVNALTLRDNTSGQLYRGVVGNRDPGASFLVGADYAYVFDSEYLPPGGPELENDRGRIRAGVYLQGSRVGMFYGLTWLSREFEGQKDDQIIGSLRLDILF